MFCRKIDTFGLQLKTRLIPFGFEYGGSIIILAL